MAVRSLYFVELAVADWRQSLAFYRDLFGLRMMVCDEDGGFALLDAGGTRLALKQGVPRPGGITAMWQVDDLRAELARLTAAGVEVASPMQVSAEGYRRAFVRDADGYTVGLFDWADGAMSP